MSLSNKTTLVGVATLFVLALVVAPLGVSGPPDNPMQFESSMNPSPGGSQTIGGHLSRQEAWTLVSGEAKITASGNLEVEVKGLFNTIDGNTDVYYSPGNPVTVLMVRATLFCAGNNQQWDTDPAPFSLAGDAKIEEEDFLSAKGIAVCNGPIILVRVAQHADDPAPRTPGQWLAVSGF
ncbi:MAG: hypothetical protein A3H27_07590 [Acidobacteria bacterium RIFCSPLOWO2_02_FULL_59_13]|nr:MAG: hypothetical protein A3H27_07590 [Acidobacteria bacterium RIFCSPLOWO2_02_FULL_59_13]